MGQQTPLRKPVDLRRVGSPGAPAYAKSGGGEVALSTKHKGDGLLDVVLIH